VYLALTPTISTLAVNYSPELTVLSQLMLLLSQQHLQI
jgi:hypothetical protein